MTGWELVRGRLRSRLTGRTAVRLPMEFIGRYLGPTPLAQAATARAAEPVRSPGRFQTAAAARFLANGAGTQAPVTTNRRARRTTACAIIAEVVVAALTPGSTVGVQQDPAIVTLP